MALLERFLKITEVAVSALMERKIGASLNSDWTMSEIFRGSADWI